MIRPRQGLPLGGLLPPELFGVDAELKFDSNSREAKYSIDDGKLDLSAHQWELNLVFENDGTLSAESQIVFNLQFENRQRLVRCKPGNPVNGSLTRIQLGENNDFSGHFRIALPICEDAKTGKDLGWPPQPFVLNGSFDRLVAD